MEKGLLVDIKVATVRLEALKVIVVICYCGFWWLKREKAEPVVRRDQGDQ